MLTNEQHIKFNSNGPRLRAPAPGLLARVLATVASVAALVVAFMFSLLIFATVAAIALVAGAYLWWKTRALRRQMREQPRGGRIIEGEAIRESATPDPAQPSSLHCSEVAGKYLAFHLVLSSFLSRFLPRRQPAFVQKMA